MGRGMYQQQKIGGEGVVEITTMEETVAMVVTGVTGVDGAEEEDDTDMLHHHLTGSHPVFLYFFTILYRQFCPLSQLKLSATNPISDTATDENVD